MSDAAGATKSVVSCNPFLDGSKTHNPLSSPAISNLLLHVLTYVAEDTRFSLQPPRVHHAVSSFARQPRRGGRNMQIREINARKFHYNSTRKISSSSCNPLPVPCAPPCNHFSSRGARNGGPAVPLLAVLSGRQEHPHYLVLPYSPRKMAEKVAGKTVRLPLPA